MTSLIVWPGACTTYPSLHTDLFQVQSGDSLTPDGKMTHKTCPGFGALPAHTKPLSEFSTNSARPDGYAAYCKVCAALSQKKWRQDHPEQVRANKKKYRVVK